MSITISGNTSGLAIAEEETPGVLPGSPVWYGLEPNGYSDFGGNVVTISRDPISATRQRKRGGIVDKDASASFGQDVTKTNFTRFMQGFVFADAYEKADTKPLNGTAVTITNIDGTNNEFDAASGLNVFAAGDILLGSGFTQAAANGLHVVQSVTAGTAVETDVDLANETPPAGARLQQVGFQFASADATMTVAAGVATLGATAKDLTEFGLQPGEWLFIGGDTSDTKFATCPVGYARVASVSATAIVFDKVTAAFVSDTGTGKTLRIFFGTFEQNAPVATDIVTRTYQLERTLGSDGVGIQSEYVIGAVANDFTLNVPVSDKVTADLAFIALDSETRDGTTGIKSGTRVAALGETLYNTSSDLYRQKLSVLAPGTLQPTALFGYASAATLSINNGCSAIKALGSVGGIDINVGNFVVGGTVDAFFSEVAAVEAVNANSDVTYDLILAANNGGIVYDIPLLGLGGGRLNVVKDQPIKLPVEMNAAENSAGYTLGVTFFDYLPTAAMPA